MFILPTVIDLPPVNPEENIDVVVVKLTESTAVGSDGTIIEHIHGNVFKLKFKDEQEIFIEYQY